MANNTDVPQAIEALEGPIPPAVQKVLDAADEHGWSLNPDITLVVRLTKADPLAIPFFMRWNLVGRTAKGKLSWRFHGARASNGQPLTLDDALLYMKDPSVIYPEPPEGEKTSGGEGNSNE